MFWTDVSWGSGVCQVGGLACGSLSRSTTSPHTVLTCAIPENTGTKRAIAVEVDSQSTTQDEAFDYAGGRDKTQMMERE